MLRPMWIWNRFINKMKMIDYLRTKGVPVRKMRPLPSGERKKVFLLEWTRKTLLPWHLRNECLASHTNADGNPDADFRMFKNSDITVSEEPGVVVAAFVDHYGNQRTIVVPSDGTVGNKFYRGKEGSMSDWPDPSQMWQDMAGTLADLVSEGPLGEQLVHPLFPVELRREVAVEGCLFEGKLGKERYITYRDHNGRDLPVLETPHPVFQISEGQVVDKYLRPSDGGSFPQAEIVVTKSGTCFITYVWPMVDIVEGSRKPGSGRLGLYISDSWKGWTGPYNEAPWKFRPAAKEAFIAIPAGQAEHVPAPQEVVA